MHNVAGEIAKTAMENVQQIGKEVGRKGGFDAPGEGSSFGARDMGRGEAGKLGSSFDGPGILLEVNTKMFNVRTFKRKVLRKLPRPVENSPKTKED